MNISVIERNGQTVIDLRKFNVIEATATPKPNISLWILIENPKKDSSKIPLTEEQINQLDARSLNWVTGSDSSMNWYILIVGYRGELKIRDNNYIE